MRPPIPQYESVRIVATDLRDLSRKAAEVKLDRPGVPVLADIYVAVAKEAALARTELATAGVDVPENSLVYVGTPRGLAGLISDIRALDIADGAVLRPLTAGSETCCSSTYLDQLGKGI